MYQPSSVVHRTAALSSALLKLCRGSTYSTASQNHWNPEPWAVSR
jgi:hypothetical protein